LTVGVVVWEFCNIGATTAATVNICCNCCWFIPTVYVNRRRWTRSWQWRADISFQQFKWLL